MQGRPRAVVGSSTARKKAAIRGVVYAHTYEPNWFERENPKAVEGCGKNCSAGLTAKKLRVRDAPPASVVSQSLTPSSLLTSGARVPILRPGIGCSSVCQPVIHCPAEPCMAGPIRALSGIRGPTGMYWMSINFSFASGKLSTIARASFSDFASMRKTTPLPSPREYHSRILPSR